MSYDTTKPYKRRLLELIERTWDTPYVSVRSGTYPIIEKKFSGLEVDHSDGIGTKGVFHWQRRTFQNAALDALAMNLNDLLLVRARPYKMQNHIMLPEDDHDAIVQIVESFSNECVKHQIAMTGGETAILNTIRGMEIGMSVSGFIQSFQKNQFQVGDALIGLASSGLHSNGFTKVRQVLGETIRDEFVVPTRIYLDEMLRAQEQLEVHGMMHITGGAFTKLKDLLPNSDAVITRDHSLKPQPIFRELFEKGVSEQEMYKTFNCGIGFVFSVPKAQESKAVSITGGYVIGSVVRGNGKVKLQSMFSGLNLVY